jgi:methylenetetrahydrofolate reductase (NADPH)
MDQASHDTIRHGTLERWLTGPRIPALPAPRDMAPPKLSFEFFPPKSATMEANLWECIRRLEPLAPRFVSVTYGAGGTTRSRTHATVSRIVAETSLTPAAHLTTVGATREEVHEVAREYWAAGVRHIVALRGDPPVGAAQYEPHPGGYAQAEDLVRGLRGVADFDITVGAYPETHPTALSPEADLDFLKRKIDAGATRALYGQVASGMQGDGYPERLLHWVETIPNGIITYCGHDTRSTDGRPLLIRGRAGGEALFMDTGAGKGGHLSWIDLGL